MKGHANQCQGLKALKLWSALPTQPKLPVQRTAGAPDTLAFVARFLFGANLPFTTVENPLFVELLRRLDPKIHLPSRKQLGGQYLQQEYELLRGRLKQSVQDQWRTLSGIPSPPP